MNFFSLHILADQPDAKLNANLDMICEVYVNLSRK